MALGKWEDVQVVESVSFEGMLLQTPEGIQSFSSSCPVVIQASLLRVFHLIVLPPYNPLPLPLTSYCKLVSWVWPGQG